MATLKVNGSSSTSAWVGKLLTAKLMPALVMPPAAGAGGADGCEGSPAALPSGSTGCSDTDKTDNHDPFPFLPHADMRREDERLKTFDKWPVPFLEPAALARNGFYYLGRGDEVRCAFCKVEIMRWVEGDDPAKDHQRWAPQCPFLRRAPAAGNVPRAPDGRDECGVRAPAPPPALGIGVGVGVGAVRMPGPVHPRYASEAARLRSFKDWPRSMRQKPEDLAEAGFFYTGHGDKTKCFYCDGGLKDWELEDVPWEQHARWFDRCAYVQLVKGRDYVQKVITEAGALPAESGGGDEGSPAAAAPAPGPRAPAAPAAAPAPASAAEEEGPVSESNLCRICYAGERNVCFVPCGHVMACAKCALATDKCPMCRRTFQSAVRLYFS